MTTVGSLCSGYGGLDIGLDLAIGPLDHAWHVEYDKAPSAILAHHWPDVPNLGDLTTLDYDAMPRVDWLTAGYPCQPFSHAGKRKGASDERHLWPFVARAIGALRPPNVLLENVRGHVSLGLDAVLADLAGLGYDASWGVVRAADAGAPHGRARIFIVATDTGRERRLPPTLVADRTEPQHRSGTGVRLPTKRGSGAAADPDGESTRGLRCRAQEEHACAGVSGVAPADTDDRTDYRERSRPESRQRSTAVAWGIYEPAVRRWEAVIGRDAPRSTEPGRTGERLSPRFVEWMQGLPAGWVTDVPGIARNAQLKALGNGVVPQQAALAVRLLLGAACEVAA